MIRFALLAALALGLAASAGWAAEAVEPAADAPTETLPADLTITKLEVAPETITLTNKYDYRQLLVTGHTADGQRVDLTRLVELEGDRNLLTVNDLRLLRPQANGAGTLIVRYRDHEARLPVAVTNAQADFNVSYVRDIMPVLAKQGCNSGTCHGAQDGKNGFKLSLRGYDPFFDYQSLTDDLGGRRFNRSAPERSLMLMKPAGEVPHQGGMLFSAGEPHYQVLRDWIAQGVSFDPETPRVKEIALSPTNPQLPLPGMKQQMRVIATYADGSTRDVTAEAFVESSSVEVLEMNKAGTVTALRRGEAAVLARYEGAYAATTITVMGDRSGYQWQPVPENNIVDTLVYQKLQRVKLLPAELCTDAEFVRRVYLDLTGLPPTPEQAAAFIDDARPTKEKRDELIEQLVGSPEYVEHFTHKWADLLQVNRKYLGVEGTWAMRGWLKQAVASNMPYDEFARTILTGSGSNLENPGAAYYKIHREPEDLVETTTQLFLGVRFNCNKCHDHPFERWTQDQYYYLAAYFAQVGRKRGPEALELARAGQNVPGTAEEIIFDAGGGELNHARTGDVAKPQFPYEHGDAAPAEAPRREQLAQWLTSPENQYFAKSFVNRMWSYLLGRGLIDPVDDIRAGNPPSNPELLDRLTEDFVASGFDVQKLVITICKSRVYQHSIQTNEWNADDDINFSHAVARRLPAEVLIDSIYRSLDAKIDYAGVPAGYRASQLPDPAVKAKGGFLDLFGRPPRESPCECERSTGVMLSQTLTLVNGPAVADAIAAKGNRIDRLIASTQDDAEVVTQLFLAILNRRPTEDELQTGVLAIQEGADRLSGAQDLAWALINSPAFLFNR